MSIKIEYRKLISVDSNTSAEIVSNCLLYSKNDLIRSSAHITNSLYTHTHTETFETNRTRNEIKSDGKMDCSTTTNISIKSVSSVSSLASELISK